MARKHKNDSAANDESSVADGLETTDAHGDANPATFVAETPVAADAQPVALAVASSQPEPLPDRIRVKLEARKAKAEAKAKRDSYSGPLKAVLVKSRNINGTAIKTTGDKPTQVADVVLSGITLVQFEGLIASRALRFEPKD